MFYPKSKTEELEEDLFKNPSSEYRGAPFWSWNTKLDKDELTNQISYFKDMGMGGFHIHCRVGLDTEYLSDEYMDCVKASVSEGKKNQLRTYLYDEDRWPSGSAGGKVTKNVEFRSCYLVLTRTPNSKQNKKRKSFKASAEVKPNGNGRLLARYEVHLENGFLSDYRSLDENEKSDDCWYLYLEVAEESPWFNNQAYVDTLNKSAIDKFIEETHEKYYKELKEDFGEAVPSIFTDEPQFIHKTVLGNSKGDKEVLLPYTESFPERYFEKNKSDFFATVPEIVWELPNSRVSEARYRYHDQVGELFVSSYADNIKDWCDKHNLYLTGHVMDEPTLLRQTRATGEAMRSYRSFHLPGIDMLCDLREYTTAKQAQSVSHQYGREGVMSELYGVTNWDFDFRGHKLQGDWQAALGITFRVLHLSWVSMAGEAKRDYPASIFYQSPWFKEYKMVEDHFARVNTALTRGKPVVRIGLIHPIESYWLHYGPDDKTAMLREELDRNFQNAAQWLLFAQLDFDYISESLLPLQYTSGTDKKFHVGEMAYDVIVIPACETLRRTTYEALMAFLSNDGKVIIMGDAPKYIDSLLSNDINELSKQCRHIPFTETAIVNELSDVREIEIRKADGTIASNLLYQMRDDNGAKWIFVANGKEVSNKDVPSVNEVEVRIKGQFDIELYNTLTGDIEALYAKHTEHFTIISRKMYDQDSILLKAKPHVGSERKIEPVKEVSYIEKRSLTEKSSVHLSEPNVLLLDLAEYSFDYGKWHGQEEILRIDNKLREKLGWPLRMEAFAQPWVDKSVEKTRHSITLRFKILSAVYTKNIKLGMEEADLAQITVNGQTIRKKIDGYFTDKCIKCIPLPDICAGETHIDVELPYEKKVNLENLFLLGDFGVEAAGFRTKLTDKVTDLSFGDYSRQGLPFYGGNVSYDLDIEVEAGEYDLSISKYRSPVIKVSVDGAFKGYIAFSPYSVSLGRLSDGKHKITVECFGSRVNTFGALHNCDENERYFGPNAWRSKEERYAYEYQLKRMGILKSPVLLRRR